MKNSTRREHSKSSTAHALRWLAAGVCVIAYGIAMAEPAPTAVAQRIKESVSSNTQGKVSIDSVSTTPIPGVFQAVSEGEVLYVDATGRYTFVGAALVDTKSQKDLTSVELDRIQAIPFASLPLDKAIKEVHGNGSRKLALFEDPNCPICRVFTKFVDQLDDVTVYRFMYPVISPESQALARTAWCSRDRGAAWKQIMNGARPAGGNESCDVTGLAEILRLGDKYQIQNTPTVVLASGKRLVGATPPEIFMKELAASGK